MAKCVQDIHINFSSTNTLWRLNALGLIKSYIELRSFYPPLPASLSTRRFTGILLGIILLVFPVPFPKQLLYSVFHIVVLPLLHPQSVRSSFISANSICYLKPQSKFLLCFRLNFNSQLRAQSASSTGHANVWHKDS